MGSNCGPKVTGTVGHSRWTGSQPSAAEDAGIIVLDDDPEPDAQAADAEAAFEAEDYAASRTKYELAIKTQSTIAIMGSEDNTIADKLKLLENMKVQMNAMQN